MARLAIGPRGGYVRLQMMPKLDCHLLFPPPWGLLQTVHLSLPLLRGHLERFGRKVAVTDLNLAVSSRLLQPQVITRAADELEKELRRGDRGRSPEQLEAMETAVAVAPLVADSIERAKQVLQSGGQLLDIAPASQVIVLASRVIAAAATPARWNPVAAEYRSAEISSWFTLDAAYRSLERTRLDPLEHALREALTEALDRAPARLYGLGAACADQLYPALRCARWIRERDPDARIVLGGSTVRFLRRLLLEEPSFFDHFDYVVVGDGEQPLEDLLRTLDGDQALDEVPNLLHRRDGRTRESTAVWHAGFEVPAPPSFAGIDLGAYYTPASFPFLAARRCYWNKCTFCAFTSGKTIPFGPTPTAELVGQLTDTAERTGCDTFTFVDEGVSGPQLRRISKALLESGHKLTWGAWARMEKQLDRESLDLAYHAGLRAIHFGLETGSQRVMDLMGKGVQMEVAERCLRDTGEAGIWTGCFLIVGFPGEEEEDFEQTIAFCRRNQETIDSIALSTFRADLLSPIAEEPERFGLEAAPHPAGWLGHSSPQRRERAETTLRRMDRWRDATMTLHFNFLNLHAVHSASLLQYLGSTGTREGLRALQTAEAEKVRARQRLLFMGPSQPVRLSRTIEIGPEREGATPVFCWASGALVVLPSAVVELCRQRTSLAELGALVSDLGEEEQLPQQLIALGLLTA